MKYVRIDDKTQIMVPVGISDEFARARYLQRINKGIREPYTPVEEKIEPAPEQLHGEEVLAGSLEEMQIMVAENTELADDE